ncbi:DNA/RNA non-specific endonuclease [Massilia sp. PWRC2]|uniref:DNA/RNA non-specific endonuclease n=1 Tax=Massilia sp. PWRC2 TaxID=2804626 RepID=UPI003CEE2ADE
MLPMLLFVGLLMLLMLPIRSISAVLFCFVAASGSVKAGIQAKAGFDDCPRFFLNAYLPKLPASAPGRQRQLCFDAFAVLYSGQSKTPLYVVERLNKAQLADASDEVRTNKFYEEARLPGADRAHLADFKARLDGEDARFDRGHMAPAADMPTARAMAQSFSLSNMVPQAPANNRGPWARSVEKATRKYVMRAAGDVYVFTGPVYSAPLRTLGPGQVWIPASLYKLVVDPSANRAWAHWIDNTDSARAGRPISYEELVRRTGIDFLGTMRPGI